MNDERRELDPALLRAIRCEVKAGVIEGLGNFVAYDLNQKDGCEELRSDLYYIHQSRVGAESLKRQVKSAAIKTTWGAAVLMLLAGLAAMLKDHIK